MSPASTGPDAGKAILDAARERFLYRPKKPYEYRKGADDTDIDGDDRLETDCSHFVHRALQDAGYKNIPYLTSTSLNNPAEAGKYYDEVSVEDVRPGDLAVFDGHVSLVDKKRYGKVNENDSVERYHGHLLHAERPWENEKDCKVGQTFRSAKKHT